MHLLYRMSNMNIKIEIDNPCIEKKGFCINCNNQFMTIRPFLRNVVVSRRFVRDLKDKEKIKSLVNDILDCSNLEFSELHKFEMNVDGNLIFRARKKNLHLVYGVNKKMSIIFLRAIGNFTEYKKFLGNRKQILKTITHVSP